MSYKFSLITALILLSSCVQPLEIEPQWEEPPVVVHCVLRRVGLDILKDAQYTTQTVELYYAGATGQAEPPEVQEAEVTIYCKDSGETYSFTNEGNGVWTSEFTPDYDCTYSLEIKIPGRETITAETRVPEEVTVILTKSIRYFSESKNAESVIEKAGLVPPGKEMGGGLLGCIKGREKNFRTKHDIYVWIRHNRGCDLTTDHIYADGCNVSSKLYSAELFSPEDLAKEDREKSSKGIVPCCFGLPLHKGFLRIVNPTDYCRSTPNRYGRMTEKNEKPTAIPEPEYDRAFVILGDFTYKPFSYYVKKLEDSDYLEMRVVSDALDKYYSDVYSYLNTNNDNIFNMVYSSSESISSNIRNGFGIFGAEVTYKHAALSDNVIVDGQWLWPYINHDAF